jgi:hypothetical protein
MNLGVTILAIVMIVFGALYAWHKLQGSKEGDLINMGFGTYIEGPVYQKDGPFAPTEMF